METSRLFSTPPPGLAPSLPAADQTPHYVQAVMKVGSRSEVLVSEDIYAASGMKLLARGARIDARHWETLSKHKLSRPLDQMLTASDCVDHFSLARDMDKVIAAHPLLAGMLARSGDHQGWKPVLGSLILPQALALRFTVMRDEAAQRYLHSLRVAVSAYCIGTRMQLGTQQMADLMLAALSHDIGEMHTDPSILAPGRSIRGDERKFIHAHPVTGYVILQQLDVIPQDAMQAVLQHHERLDGSGYPYRERGARIGMLARIIAISEKLDAVSRHVDHGQIPIVFRLHQGRLDEDGVNALADLLPQGGDAHGSGRAAPGAERSLGRLCAVLQDWPVLQDEIRNTPAVGAYQFIEERMMQFQSLARQCGISPELLELLDVGQEDAVMSRDLHTTLGEMGRLLDGLAFEIERRVPGNGPHGALSAQIIGFLRP
jgi:HD-GYP domain-containing protein (c-di-GMP phosphodiesterase class II)